MGMIVKFTGPLKTIKRKDSQELVVNFLKYMISRPRLGEDPSMPLPKAPVPCPLIYKWGKWGVLQFSGLAQAYILSFPSTDTVATLLELHVLLVSKQKMGACLGAVVYRGVRKPGAMLRTDIRRKVNWCRGESTDISSYRKTATVRAPPQRMKREALGTKANRKSLCFWHKNRSFKVNKISLLLIYLLPEAYFHLKQDSITPTSQQNYHSISKGFRLSRTNLFSSCRNHVISSS